MSRDDSVADLSAGTWRLRDLTPPQRWIAATLMLLLALPFAFSAFDALSHDWLPSGDDAVISVRVHDVLSRNPPLTGLPSTSDLYGGGIQTRHPGPFEFYLLALPVKVLGLSAGMLFGAAAINLAGLLIGLWVFLRRAGPGVAAGAAVVLAATIYSTGPAVLSDPISSNIGGYALLGLTVLVWALACGDYRLLPLTALMAAFAAQQHLAVVPAVALLSAWGLSGLGWTLIPKRPQVGRVWPWFAAAAGASAVVWAPVLIQQFTADPGNITAVVRFARDSDRPTLGLRRGLTQVLRTAGYPPWVLRRNLTGFQVAAPLGPLGVATGITALTTAVGAAVLAWRRRPDLGRLGATALVVVVVGAISGSSVPRSIEADRINLYRWTWPLALCLTVLIGWLLGLAIKSLTSRWDEVGRLLSSGISRWLPAATSVVLVLAFVISSLGASGVNSERRDSLVFAADSQLADAAIEHLAGSATEGPVVVVPSGGMADLSVAPAIEAQLAERSIRFEVPAKKADAFGDGRAFDPENASEALVVVSAFGPLATLPGKRLGEARLNPDLAAAIDRVVAASKGQPVVPSAQAAELLRTRLLPFLAAAAKVRIARIDSDPYASLTSPEALLLLDAGYLDSPKLDPSDIRTLLLASRERTLTVWGDDRVALYAMSIEQLRTVRPDVFG